MPSRRSYLATASMALSGLAGCQSLRSRLPGGVRLEARTPALRDTDPAIVVRNLEPGSRVQLESSSKARYERWTAQATFRADETGVVRVSEQAPESGDYSTIDGAGLIWSMAPDGKPLEPWSNEAFSVEIRAIQDGAVRDRVTLDRRRARSDVKTQWVTAEAVVGMFAEPDIETPGPGVVVLHGSSGVPMTHYAEMFASHGFPALALKYFGEEGGIPDHLQAVPLEYFDGAAAWLRSQETVQDGPLGVYGFSRGGEAALFIASYADWAGAVVGDMASGIAWQAVRRDGGRASGSAWAVDGDPLSFVPYEGCSPEYTESGLRRDAAYYECGLSKTDAGRVDEATFPLERFDGAVLCLSGARDGVWPSTRLTEVAADRLRAVGSTQQFAHHVYEEAGHDIPIPHVPTDAIPTAGGRLIGGTPSGIARAATDSWPKVLATFDTLA